MEVLLLALPVQLFGIVFWNISSQTVYLLLSCEVVFGPAYMGHCMHVVRAVTQRAAPEDSWASWPEKEKKENRRGIFFSVFLERGYRRD